MTIIWGFPTNDDASNGYHVIVITTNERFTHAINC